MDFLEMMHADAMRDAARLLARRGYDNVQAAGLAGAMRMSVGSMYRYYGSKRGLALAVRDFTEKTLSYRAEVAFLLRHGKPGVDFAQAFLAFWWELAGWALAHPDLFNFTFLHWHAQEYGPHSPPAPGPRVAGALIPQQSNGGATRVLVREVLEKGEREGALAPDCSQVGEGLVWGALVELARTAAQPGARVGEAEVLASARALWRALAHTEDSGPQGTGTPHPGTETSSPGASGGLTAAPAPALLLASVTGSSPNGEMPRGLLPASVADSPPETHSSPDAETLPGPRPAPLGNASLEGKALRGLPETLVAESVEAGAAPQIRHEAPVTDSPPARKAPQSCPSCKAPRVLLMVLVADACPHFEGSATSRMTGGSGASGGASGAGRPRTRFAQRRSTCDAIGTRRPRPRASSSTRLPRHPIERTECSDRACRNPRRSLLRVPRRPEGLAYGPRCWHCLYRREPKHRPSPVAPAASCK